MNDVQILHFLAEIFRNSAAILEMGWTRDNWVHRIIKVTTMR
jgi:hypothetical protein